MATMKEHCYLGYKIISRIPFLAEAAEIRLHPTRSVRRLGYPRGLEG